jgi:hypothetical protein
MNKYEKVFLNLVLGMVMPVIGFLAGWWSFCKIASNSVIILAAVSGLAVGLIVDAFFLKKWVDKAYQFNPVVWMAIYLFYSICVFGFFMGVPVFNLVLALPAGVLIGGELSHVSSDAAQQQKTIFRGKLFTTLTLAAVCASSAVIALNDPTTAANLEGMLRLSFKVTQPMIVGLIVVGGGVVLFLQWLLTARFIRVGQQLAARPF